MLWWERMERKSERMEIYVNRFTSGVYEKEYHGFFQLYNQGRYYESHDVLEHLWLQRKGTGDDHFFKALIQLAGCFVHLEKGRSGPALRLFRLCRGYLSQYGTGYRGLDIIQTTEFIDGWIRRLEAGEAIVWEREVKPYLHCDCHAGGDAHS